MKKDIFKKIITDNQEYLPERQTRALKFPVDSNKIITVKGPRRSGKTSLFYSTINELKKIHNPSQIVYINFDDDRLHPIDITDCRLFIDAYYELFPSNKEQNVYFFFDEIQNVKSWEKFVRRIYDTEKCKIFLTGSSSKLLSHEIATSLRGRTISYSLLPLSFDEYLHFHQVEVNIHSSSKVAVVRNLFGSYLQTGGFPELFIEKDLKEKILREYIDMIIYKDLIERYNISNLFLIKYLIRYCLTNISTLISINRLYNSLKSQGIKVSKNTLYEYFTLLEESMIIYQVPLFTESFSVQQRNPKKIYSVDIGLKRAVSFDRDIGRIYENIVFNHIQQFTEEVFYYNNKQEVDFIYRGNNRLNIINVSYDIEDRRTRQREVQGLVGAMNDIDTSEATLITDFREEIIEQDKKVIKIVPLWKWLLTEKY
ncbi:MAG: ATP-binding protein [Bacteroidetes bacterium]|nr:ATP-binding protein [Bacteroidota bacterium]